MKYLKKFKATDSNFIKLKNEFTDFANDCLAYLVDQGFIISVKVRNTNTYDSCLLEFTLVKNEGDINFQNGWSWDSIKDDFIPFLELVKEKFIVDHIVKFTTIGFGYYGKINTLNIDFVINDDTTTTRCILRNNNNIRNISFSIKDYK